MLKAFLNELDVKPQARENFSSFFNVNKRFLKLHNSGDPHGLGFTATKQSWDQPLFNLGKQ